MVQVGLTVTGQLGGPPRFTGDPGATLDPSQVAATARQVALDRRLDRWFAAPTTRVEAPDAEVLPGPRGDRAEASPLAGATLIWLDRSCEGLGAVRGNCVPGRGEAVISDRTARTFSLRLGNVLTLRPPGVEPFDVRVSGIWSTLRSADEIWGASTPQQWAEPRQPDAQLRIDAVLLSRADLDRRALQERRARAAVGRLSGG